MFPPRTIKSTSKICYKNCIKFCSLLDNGGMVSEIDSFFKQGRTKGGRWT